MGVKWTEEQQKVISLRDRNILVSAAAGSGKLQYWWKGFSARSQILRSRWTLTVF